MRFFWTARCNHNNMCNRNINVRLQYKNIAQKFCSEYYRIYDTNPRDLHRYYTPRSIFVYIDEELTGFNALYGKMMHYNMYIFTHHTMNVSAMPVGINGILITVNGTMSINNSFEHIRFTETILLKKAYGTQFFAMNTILKIDRSVPFVNFDDPDLDILDEYF